MNKKTDIIVTKTKSGTIDIHFPGDVTVLEGWDYLGELLEKGVDVHAYSRVFLRHSKN